MTYSFHVQTIFNPQKIVQDHPTLMKLQIQHVQYVQPLRSQEMGIDPSSSSSSLLEIQNQRTKQSHE